MLLRERLRIANALVKECVVDGSSIGIFGAGIWFSLIERALARSAWSSQAHILSYQLSPLLRIVFASGGSIICADLDTGANMEVVTDAKSEIHFDKAYVVEDRYGVNSLIWKELVAPLLSRGNCKVIHLGAPKDEEKS